MEDGVNEILNDLHLADSFLVWIQGFHQEFWKMIRGVQAYLRGAFLASGSVKDT